MERIVTPEAPVRGVKKASTNVVMMARPPGIHPTKAENTFINRLLAPPSERMYPPKVNNGMAGSIGCAVSR